MKKKEYLYLVRVGKHLDDLHNKGFRLAEWWFLARSYDNTCGGVPISVFTTRKEAQEAIAMEKRLFKQTRQQIRNDIKSIKKHGLDKRYKGIVEYMISNVNAYARAKKLYYKIQPVLKEKWEQICDPKGGKK